MSQAIDATRIPELSDVISMALAEARAAGATQAEADCSLQQGLNVTVRLGEVETIEYQRDRALGITVYFNGAKGSASSADLRPDAVRQMVAKACSIARHTTRDEFAGLADPADMAREIPDLDLYHPWELTPEQAIEQGARMRSRGHGRGPPHHQLRGRHAFRASRRARLWQLAWFPRRLSQLQPQHQLRAAGAG